MKEDYPKNNIPKIEEILEKGREGKTKLVVMLAPSFVAEFDYPALISQLKQLGFDKIVELTFGAKLVNREYHKILSDTRNAGKLFISSVCPGTVDFIKRNFPEYTRNLMPVDSPMIAMAKICKKVYPNHKTIFISPCQYKKIEAQNSKYVDYVMDYQELACLLATNRIKKMPKIDGFSVSQNLPCQEHGILNPDFKINPKRERVGFDKFYNDYTKIYPLSGGLSKTAHIKGILDEKYSIVLDGVFLMTKFLKHHSSHIRFVDTSFCVGGCIGGPCLSKTRSLEEKRKRVMHYIEVAKKEKIPAVNKGNIKKAEGISFERRY